MVREKRHPGQRELRQDRANVIEEPFEKTLKCLSSDLRQECFDFVEVRGEISRREYRKAIGHSGL
ncbi:MAG: hypothetical protein FJ143_08300 [Deltaproteobacteria bacterium]|nr:hypothetical protein [Deltaproteobacteria bacterium]